MQVPTPGKNQNLALVIGLVILAIAFGDYYVLLHQAEIRQARAWVKANPELTPQQKRIARQIELRRRHADRMRTGVSKKKTESVNGMAGRDSISTVEGAGGGLGSAGSDIKRKSLLKADSIYNKAGIYFRLSLLAASLAFLFIQKAPERKLGQPKLKPISGKNRKVIFLLCGGFFLISSYVLLTIAKFPLDFILYGYPMASLVGILSTFVAGLVIARSKRPDFGLTTERKKLTSENGFSLPTQDGGYINVPNAFRGNLVLGGAGAGKSFSIGEPVIEQFASKNWAGLIYDFKFPVLTEVAQRALTLAAEQAEAKGEPEPSVQLHVINFRDLTRTERLNPLRPEEMPVVAFAEEYSRAIINNLNTNTIKNSGEFFSTSAIAYLTGIIWFYRKNFPAYCTIPHVVATALYKDFRHVLSMLDTDIECGDMVRSLITAVEQKAEKQIAGVVATLQIILSRINSPEIVWVLTPDESRGEGFSLDLNDPNNPKLLCIGNDPTLKDTFSPVISCIITVALKLMNQQRKHPSYVFLDEAATIYVPGLEVIPATARSNKIATIYMSQDLSQMVDSYGRDKMQVMISNLNNWFIGKVNNMETAELISKIVGREDKSMVSTSSGSSTGGAGHRNRSQNQSVSLQERSLVRIQDAVGLEQGEFIGQTVETESAFFQGRIDRSDAQTEIHELEPFALFADEGETDSQEAQRIIVQANYQKVRDEVKETVEMYPNTLAPGEE
ncbi:TraM recognition domain-containing protein [Rufibacter hautae]|uniref:Type IV secretory system conjugative DNA transfer family protein n=1 Tax=Rufibacter hautae TaxID=2595005 RepID=A0A5B6TA76_9BACT|nr:TraM recognition domain-containing protein [Rufibacter hautae]KAA3435979.1 type IV secretory system conjugative DNA transfer family protein [Rufibacter hautae]